MTTPHVDPALRSRIEDFLTDCAHSIDDDRLEEWPECFTDDAVYQITTRENHEAGRPIGIFLCDGQGMMKDRVQALREANLFEPHRYCHLLGRPRIDADGADTYTVRSNFTVIRTMQGGSPETFAAGKYLDRIVLQNGALKFAERRVILDSRRVDILIVYPL